MNISSVLHSIGSDCQVKPSCQKIRGKGSVILTVSQVPICIFAMFFPRSQRTESPFFPGHHPAIQPRFSLGFLGVSLRFLRIPKLISQHARGNPSITPGSETFENRKVLLFSTPLVKTGISS